MFFRIKNTYETSAKISKVQYIINAKRIIIMYPMHTNEKMLDKYLIENYDTNLKLMCLALLDDIKFTTDASNYIIGTFNHEDKNKIAELITYGNEKLKGSAILRTALSN